MPSTTNPTRFRRRDAWRRRRRATRGGASSDDETEKLLNWHEAREKELLDAVAVLSTRLVRTMERVEELEAAAAATAEA